MLVFFRGIGSVIKKTYRWCKKNSTLVIATLVGVITMVIYIVLRRSAAELEIAKDTTRIAQAKIKIAAIETEINDLKVKKAVIEEKDDEAGRKVAVIDKKLKALDETMAAYKRTVKKLSTDDTLDEFKTLGY